MSESFAKAFGARLRAARVAAGYTQETLGDAVGIEAVAVGRFERGAFLPRAERIAQLAKALDVSTDHLLGLTLPGAKRGGLKPEARRLAEHLSELEPRAVLLLQNLIDILERKTPQKKRS
jgi:transcriptional regulator with XRE-family HTH domain